MEALLPFQSLSWSRKIGATAISLVGSGIRQTHESFYSQLFLVLRDHERDIKQKSPSFIWRMQECCIRNKSQINESKEMCDYSILDSIQDIYRNL